jgi:hypothetical protein
MGRRFAVFLFLFSDRRMTHKMMIIPTQTKPSHRSFG